MIAVLSNHYCKACLASNIVILFKKDNYYFKKCIKCGLIFVDPLPEEGEELKLYNKSGKAAYYEGADQEGILYANKLKLGFLKDLHAINFNSWQRILDIGCGGGFFLNAVREIFDKLYGLEISSELAEFVKKKWDIDVHIGNILNIDFPKNYFDIITLYDVLEHMFHPDELLREIHRILKPGGVVVVSTPNVNGLSAKSMKDKWLFFTPPEHLYYFSPNSLRIFFEANGFRVCKVRTENIYINNILMQKFRRKISRKELRSSTSKISTSIRKHNSLSKLKNVINKVLETCLIGDVLIFYACKRN